MNTPQTTPLYCRSEAYGLFNAQMMRLETTGGLLRAAVAVAMHEMPDVRIAQIEAEIASLSRSIRQRVRSDHPDAILAHAHEVLFEEEHFAGDVEDYYSALNSYVPAVLQRRRGIPITLTLIYKAVLEPLDIHVVGINAPAHFLAGVEVRGALMLIDPFYGGRVMTRQEVMQRIAGTFNHPEEQTGGMVGEMLLTPASHRQWLSRMLMNLVNVYAASGRHQDLAAMLELRDALQQ